MRLIDADALIDVLECYLEWDNALYVQSKIENAPTVDAVPVTRCKDCRYRYTDPQCKDILNDNWYCAAGEPKEKEGGGE